jgi:hypothetical protein
MEKELETVLSLLPDDSVKANILFYLHYFKKEEFIDVYKREVIDNFYGKKDPNVYLFSNSLYPIPLKNIHERISYEMFDKVIRNGYICKYCKSNNTTAKERLRGGGDEYIPLEITCHNCGRKFKE